MAVLKNLFSACNVENLSSLWILYFMNLILALTVSQWSSGCWACRRGFSSLLLARNRYDNPAKPLNWKIWLSFRLKVKISDLQKPLIANRFCSDLSRRTYETFFLRLLSLCKLNYFLSNIISNMKPIRHSHGIQVEPKVCEPPGSCYPSMRFCNRSQKILLWDKTMERIFSSNFILFTATLSIVRTIALKSNIMKKI